MSHFYGKQEYFDPQHKHYLFHSKQKILSLQSNKQESYYYHTNHILEKSYWIKITMILFLIFTMKYYIFTHSSINNNKLTMFENSSLKIELKTQANQSNNYSFILILKAKKTIHPFFKIQDCIITDEKNTVDSCLNQVKYSNSSINLTKFETFDIKGTLRPQIQNPHFLALTLQIDQKTIHLRTLLTRASEAL